jgi:hypothetical protein
MGQWLSNNVLLPIMYILIDFGLAILVMIGVLMFLDKIANSNLIDKIRNK